MEGKAFVAWFLFQSDSDFISGFDRMVLEDADNFLSASIICLFKNLLLSKALLTFIVNLTRFSLWPSWTSVLLTLSYNPSGQGAPGFCPHVIHQDSLL